MSVHSFNKKILKKHHYPVHKVKTNKKNLHLVQTHPNRNMTMSMPEPQNPFGYGQFESFLQWCIIQKFLNKVHVRKQHPPTAVPLQAEGIKGIT